MRTQIREKSPEEENGDQRGDANADQWLIKQWIIKKNYELSY